MASARPQVTVQAAGADHAGGAQLKIPACLVAPIRTDIVQYVHTSIAKNKRQPYAVSEGAGHQHSAASWGTGRAVARIPRVSGSGTARAAQGAFGNMCRKGRMFAPTKTWRKWHVKVNQNQRRYAVVSALSASAIPGLVMARGHRVEQVAEVPLVIPSSVESINKTKKAIEVLKSVGGYDDVEKVKASKKLRAGKGKMRNRRHTQRRGPLVVYGEDKGLVSAFRNLPGVELANVERLNLLQLAPGGHVGRFIVWTESAFRKLDAVYGTTRRVSSQKKGYTLPQNIVTNSDITRIINSDEVQGKLRASIKVVTRARRKKNPLKNLGAMVKLNPYALSARRQDLLAAKRAAKDKDAVLEARRAKQTKARKAHRAAQKATFKRISQD